MIIDDPALPAAKHLVDDSATDALAVAVAAYGGRLGAARATEVQYRPGRDVVVRYGATVAWGSAGPRRETLLASTTHDGIPPGTVPVEATDADGGTLSLGVWRWPYDPVLVGLADAVTPHRAESRLAGIVAPRITLRVRAYRPTERAVVQVTGGDGTDVFVKVLPTADIDAVVDRHHSLAAAGLPVPAVLDADRQAGLVVLSALAGRTMREQLNSTGGRWPTVCGFHQLFDRFATSTLPSAQAVRSRAATALGHARMLTTVAPELAAHLDAFDAPLHALAARAELRSGPVIHGDLYDAQLFSEGGRITGVLDIDDAGPGDPVDDRATVIGFLMTRAVHAGSLRAPLMRYAATLRNGFSTHVERSELDVATAAVLIGLATGPFRTRRPDWRAEVIAHLALAQRLLDAPDRAFT